MTNSIENIVVIPEFNIRAGTLSQDKVRDYVEHFDALPPICVFVVDDKFYLVDGWHRMAAAVKLERKDLKIQVVGEGTLVEAQDWADGANLQHGLPLTREQRIDVALRFHDRHPEWSNRELAERMGCSHPTIAAWLEERDGKNLPVDEKIANKPATSASQIDRAAHPDIKSVSGAFANWCNRIMQVEKPERWSEDRKKGIKASLQPIVDFYNKL